MLLRAPVPKRLARGLLACAGATCAAGAFAQGPTVYSVSVPMEIERDSNPAMALAGSRGTTFVRVTPSIAARHVSGAQEYRLEAALAAEKSSNPEVAQDRLDPRLQAGWKNADALNTIELTAVLDRRAFRQLEVREHVPVGANGARTLFALGGRWLRELDARTSSSVDVGQEWDRYSGTPTPEFRRTHAALRLNRQQDERRSWYAALNGQAYLPESAQEPSPGAAGASRSTVAGALVGIAQALSEALRVDASAGVVHFTQPSGRNEWQAVVRAEYAAERWLAWLDASRTPDVSATLGSLVVTEQVRLHLRRDIDALTRVELDAGRSMQRAAGSTRSTASAAWVRQWSPSWDLAVKASMLLQGGPSGNARSTRIALLVVYNGLDL